MQDSQLIPLAKAADYYGVVDVFDLCAERIALKARGQVDVSFLPGNPDEFPSPPELSKRHVSTPDAPKRPTRRRIHGGDGSLQPLQLSFWGQDTRQYLTAHYREVVLRLACMYSDGATFELCPAYRARKLVAAVHAPVDFDACRTTCPNFFKCIERISERRPTNGIV